MTSFCTNASGYVLSGVAKETFVMCCVIKDGIQLSHGLYTADYYPAEFSTFANFQKLMRNYDDYCGKTHTYDVDASRLMIANLKTELLVDKKFTLDLIPYKPRTAIVINEEITQFMKGMDAHFTKLFLDFPAHCVILGHAMKSNSGDSADSVFGNVEKELARICNMDYARIAEHEKFRWVHERVENVKVLHANWVKQMKGKFARAEGYLTNGLTTFFEKTKKTVDLAYLTNHVCGALRDYIEEQFYCQTFYEFDVGRLVSVRTDEDDEDDEDDATEIKFEYPELAELIAKDIMEKELFGYKKSVVVVSEDAKFAKRVLKKEIVPEPVQVVVESDAESCAESDSESEEESDYETMPAKNKSNPTSTGNATTYKVKLNGYGKLIEWGARDSIIYPHYDDCAYILQKFSAIDSSLTAEVLIGAFPFQLTFAKGCCCATVTIGMNDDYPRLKAVQQHILSILDTAVAKKNADKPVVKPLFADIEVAIAKKNADKPIVNPVLNSSTMPDIYATQKGSCGRL